MSIFEYDKEEEEKKLRRAEYEYGKEEGRKEGIKQGRTEERIYILQLISQMSAGGDAEKIPQLDNPEVMETMKRKYEI